MNYAYQGKHPPQRLAAMVAQSSDMMDQWITDTGATHHMTSDLSNLSLKSEYPGMDAVVVENGMKLPISFLVLPPFMCLILFFFSNTFYMFHL